MKAKKINMAELVEILSEIKFPTDVLILTCVPEKTTKLDGLSQADLDKIGLKPSQWPIRRISYFHARLHFDRDVTTWDNYISWCSAEDVEADEGYFQKLPRWATTVDRSPLVKSTKDKLYLRFLYVGYRKPVKFIDSKGKPVKSLSVYMSSADKPPAGAIPAESDATHVIKKRVHENPWLYTTVDLEHIRTIKIDGQVYELKQKKAK